MKNKIIMVKLLTEEISYKIYKGLIFYEKTYKDHCYQKNVFSEIKLYIYL